MNNISWRPEDSTITYVKPHSFTIVLCEGLPDVVKTENIENDNLIQTTHLIRKIIDKKEITKYGGPRDEALEEIRKRYPNYIILEK